MEHFVVALRKISFSVPMKALAILRPSHWIKNLLVFVPLFFGGALHDPVKVKSVIVAYAAFCLVASGGYAWNDIMDKEEDAQDARKKNRPIPTGAASSLHAGFVGFASMSTGIGIAATYIPHALPSIGFYAAASALYSLYAKRIPVIELLFFPAFYLARVFTGGAVAGITPSHWLLLCIIFISLFIIAIKRKAEANERMYPKTFLDLMVAIFGGSALMSYGLYGVLGARSPYAVYSMLFPIAGVMRYLMIAEKEKGGEYPEKTVIQDPFIAGSVTLWILFMYALLY